MVEDKVMENNPSFPSLSEKVNKDLILSTIYWSGIHKYSPHRPDLLRSQPDSGGYGWRYISHPTECLDGILHRQPEGWIFGICGDEGILRFIVHLLTWGSQKKGLG